MMKGEMCPVHKTAMFLLIVGGLNWGLVGAFNLNVVHLILSAAPALEAIVYILVGLSAIAMLAKGSCKACMGDMKK